MGPGPQRMRSGGSEDTGRKRPGFSEVRNTSDGRSED